MAQRPDPIYINKTADWDYLRPIITKLYVGDGWELRRVMEEIKTQYGFKATEKMYKQRLQKWHLRKHNRRREVETLLKIKHEREKLGKQSKFILGGQEVDWDDIERYRRRNQIPMPDSDTEAIASDIPDLIISTPPSSPSLAASPVVLTPPSSSDASSPSESASHDEALSSDPASSAWPGSMVLVVSSSSSSTTTSPPSVPINLALPAALNHLEAFMRGVISSFEIMMTTRTWNLSDRSEMPWNPTLVHAISEPVIAPWYHLDECARYLDNGLVQSKKGDMITAGKEWNAAMSLVSHVVESTHYNVISKLLDSMNQLYQNGYGSVSDIFRRHVRGMAGKRLGFNHPYYPLFCALENLPLEDLTDLQMNVLDCLVKALENFLGPEAFTSFEYKMLLALRKIEAYPDQVIDELMPTDIECDNLFGPTSSKTLLALNLRIGALKNRKLLEEAQKVCLKVVDRAMLVEDPAQRLWHLSSAYVGLASVQYDLGLLHPMRFSLQEALVAEGELRSKYGIIKLGEGELNWIAEKQGFAPMFRDVDVDMDE